MIPLTVIAVSYALIVWPLLAAHRRRDRPAHTASLTAAIDVTIVLVAALVLCLVLMPVGDSRDSTLNLMPGTDMMTAFADGGSCWQVGGNLLLLSPLGALLPLRVPSLRAIFKITLSALIVSILIEGMQYLIHAGRVTSTDDVLLNTIGAAVGAMASRSWWREVRPVPVPLVIPAQKRRTLVCESPLHAVRTPRSAWNSARPNVFALTAADVPEWSWPSNGRPSSTRNAS